MLEITTADLLWRLGTAMLVGFVIGAQRAWTYHSAGLRTHMLVCIGACVVMLTSLLIFRDTNSQFQVSPDPARLSAQVVSGIGFLGAGTILKEGFSVRGLTTAASLWAIACLGLAAGMGYFGLVVVGTVALFVTLSTLEGLQRKWRIGRKAQAELRIECEEMSNILLKLESMAHQFDALLRNLSFERTEQGTHLISFCIVFPGKDTDETKSVFLQQMALLPGILHMENI